MIMLCGMVATHPYSQNPAKNGYFDMAFQPLGCQNGLIHNDFPAIPAKEEILL